MVSGTDFGGAFSNRAVDGAYHWIKGPVVTPFLTNKLTGVVTYNSSTTTGSVTDQTGAVGTINVASTFSVNFSDQSVAANIQATTGAGAWIGAGSGIRLEEDGRFFASSGSTSPHNNMTVTLGGSGVGTFGQINGSLMGTAADAAGVSFLFGEGATNRARVSLSPSRASPECRHSWASLPRASWARLWPSLRASDHRTAPRPRWSRPSEPIEVSVNAIRECCSMTTGTADSRQHSVRIPVVHILGAPASTPPAM